MPHGSVNVKRPKVIVFDILGTATKSGFLEKILFPYLQNNLDLYIKTHWTRNDFVAIYQKIVESSTELNARESTVPLVMPHVHQNAQQSLLSFVTYVTENGINSPAVTKLRFKVWFEGYEQGKITTPVYSDVPRQMKAWFAEGIKFYVFSNAWIEAQKAMFRITNHGDLTNLISGFFDNDFGLLTEVDSWRRLATEIGMKPNDVLFLTKAPLEANAAIEAGISVVLVLTHRHNVKAVPREERQRMPYVRSFEELHWLEGSMQPSGNDPASLPAAVAGPSQTIATGVVSNAASNMPLASSHPTHLSGASGTSSTAATSQGASSGAYSGTGSRVSHKSSRPRSTSKANAGAVAGAPSMSATATKDPAANSGRQSQTGKLSGHSSASASPSSVSSATNTTMSSTIKSPSVQPSNALPASGMPSASQVPTAMSTVPTVTGTANASQVHKSADKSMPADSSTAAPSGPRSTSKHSKTSKK